MLMVHPVRITLPIPTMVAREISKIKCIFIINVPSLRTVFILVGKEWVYPKLPVVSLVSSSFLSGGEALISNRTEEIKTTHIHAHKKQVRPFSVWQL